MDKLRISMDLAPMTDQGLEYLEEHADEPRPFRLINYHGVKPNVPVYITYFTAYPNPASGQVEFYPDFYGYDEAVAGEIPFLF